MSTLHHHTSARYLLLKSLCYYNSPPRSNTEEYVRFIKIQCVENLIRLSNVFNTTDNNSYGIHSLWVSGNHKFILRYMCIYIFHLVSALNIFYFFFYLCHNLFGQRSEYFCSTKEHTFVNKLYPIFLQGLT